MRRPSLVFPLAALALVTTHLITWDRDEARSKIRHIMNDAAITQRVERDKVWDAAHDNNFASLPPAEVKPAHDVRQVMLDHQRWFHPKP